MAHFAKLDEGNNVIKVIVISNDDEIRGVQMCKIIDGDPDGKWVQGSYNDRMRNKMPSMGDFFDETKNVFLVPKPFDSWTLNEDFKWVSPIPTPELTEENSRSEYIWDEDLYQKDNSKGWVLDG